MTRKKLNIIFILLVAVIFQSCNSLDAATVNKKKDTQEDPSVKVISSNMVSVYNPSCGCPSSNYQNIIAKVVIGNDTFVTVQRYDDEGSVTVTKISK
jgi:PBP1b-binding outer membrane lipoprotein LpoB